MKHIFIVVIFCFSFSGIKAQINVIKVGQQANSPVSEGIFYALPQTVIQVDIVVNKIQQIKGPYAEFADQMLGLSQVTMANSTEYQLKDIKLTSFTEPDPGQYFFIEKPRKLKDKKALELFLSEDGILTGAGIVNPPLNSRKALSADLTTSGAKFPEVANPNVQERTDTVIKRISLDSTIIEQKFFRKTSTAKTTEQKAREAAEFILKLDESMYNLVTGYQETNYEKGTMEFMYNQMNAMKQDYLDLFKGISHVSSETLTFYFIPDSKHTVQDICRFSGSKGIMPVNSPVGDMVQLEATNMGLTAAVNADSDKLLQAKRKLSGLYYRIPDKANVSFKIGGQIKLETQFLINQFGNITLLPATTIRNITLDNNTGTLRHVVLE